MLRSIRPKNRVIIGFLAIPVIWYVFSVFVPLVAALFYSFFQWMGGPDKTFIGTENYAQLFQDKTFWQAFVHNLYIVLACIIGQIGIAFINVLMINSRLCKCKGMHRTFGFFPSTISAVYIGLIWTMIYDNKRGLINWILRNTGHADQTQVWLNNKDLVLPLVSIPLVWQFIGYYMVILLSAIAAVDNEIFEVAELDGASAFQRAIYIVLPLIKDMLLVCVTLCVAGNMKVFDHIYAMTKGGPGTASMVMALYGYNVSFKQSNLGYGSAISVAIFVVSLAVIGGSQWIMNFLMRNKGVD
jgi:raffinose/stachyose/melibiose transport system permease protein